VSGRRRRLFVTGGSGYLGRVVVELAAIAGWDVVAPTSGAVDVRDPVALGEAMSGAEAIVHTAYVRDGPTAAAIIVDGTANVVRAAAGRRLVHLSTDVVFDGRLGRPYREDDPPSPVTDYGRAKAAAERIVAVAPAAVIVRTSLIYGGPGRPPSPHELVAADPDATFHDDELRCPVQVDDLAAAVVELAVLDVSGPLHVAGPVGLSRADFAVRITGRPVRRGEAPPGRPLDCRLDSTRARSILRAPLRGPDEVLSHDPT
jgi:dTDP-4-dehydrorhamnose reductase